MTAPTAPSTSHFSLDPGIAEMDLAKQAARMVENLLDPAGKPGSALTQFISSEAIFQAVNAQINALQARVRKDAIREILQRIHDVVDPRIVAVRITAELEQDDDDTARYAPAFAFGLLEDGEVEFYPELELDKVFFPYLRDNPCDALRTIAWDLAEDLQFEPEEALEISLPRRPGRRKK